MRQRSKENDEQMNKTVHLHLSYLRYKRCDDMFMRRKANALDWRRFYKVAGIVWCLDFRGRAEFERWPGCKYRDTIRNNVIDRKEKWVVWVICITVLKVDCRLIQLSWCLFFLIGLLACRSSLCILSGIAFSKKTYLSRYNARWADEDIEMQALEPKLWMMYVAPRSSWHRC